MEEQNVIGIFTLPTEMYCNIDCLISYDAVIEKTKIKILFPQYIEPRDRRLDMGSLIAPEVAKHLRRGQEELTWGRIDHKSENNTGGIIQLIAIECKESDAQTLYTTFNPWMERFLDYCFLCNKQLCYAVEITTSGGNFLELVGNKGYIRPEKPHVISMTLNYEPEETYLRKAHIEKAIEYASSCKQIRPEYEFMQQAYLAEQKHEHKLAIINACSALESCMLQEIDLYCNQHAIDSDILIKKYKYLSELVELESRFDNGFASLRKELQENVCKVRNAALHFNRNAAPNRETALKCINSVEKALLYFYDDYAE